MPKGSQDIVKGAANEKTSTILPRTMLHTPLAIINQSGMSQSFERDFADEEARRPWELDFHYSTPNQGPNSGIAGIESNAAFLYHALNPQGQLANVAQDYFTYQQGRMNHGEQLLADAMHHQLACQAMGLTIPPIPDCLRHDSSGFRSSTAPEFDVRKRRNVSSRDDEQECDSFNVPAKRKCSENVSEGKRTGKRFAWPEDLHRDFVSAIFSTGLKQ